MTAAEERTVSLGGREWTLRPTFRVVAAAEHAAGMGAYALGLRIASAECRVGELATVLHAMIGASGEKQPKVDEIGTAMMEEGITTVVGAMADILLRAFQGNKAWRAAQAEREKEAAEPASDPLA